MWEYSKGLTHHLTPTGYACYNEEQGVNEFGMNNRCVDMEIRFCCPNNLKTGSCDEPGYEFTDWLNSDSPDYDGDWETLYRFDQSQGQFKKIKSSSDLLHDNFLDNIFILIKIFVSELAKSARTQSRSKRELPTLDQRNILTSIIIWVSTVLIRNKATAVSAQISKFDFAALKCNLV